MHHGPGHKLQRMRICPPGKAPGQVPDQDLGISWWFWCPGCEGMHRYITKNPAGEKGPEWGFNGNEGRPTFTPSLLVNGSWKPSPEQIAAGVHRCHLYLTDGNLQFLGDCTHKLAGQTVPLT